MRNWAIGLLLMGTALAASAEVRPPADVSVQPGEYATLLFSVWGSGSVRPAVLAPAGWQFLPLPESLLIKDRSFVALTVRVPDLTPAASRHPLVLQVWQGNRLLSQATAYVVIKPKVDLILYLEDKRKARIGEPIAYGVTVINRGNQTDRIKLSAEPNTGEAFISPDVLKLAPGEEGRAVLTLQIGEGRSVSSGYTMFTWVRARSVNGDLVRKARASTRWLDPLAFEGRSPDPTLRFNLSSSLGLNGGIEAGTLSSLSLRYSVQPTIAGQFSDYVDGRAQPAAIRGGTPNWLPAAPRSLTASLKGRDWDAALAATTADLGLQAGFKAPSWRYSLAARGRYDVKVLGFSVGVTSTHKDLNLQINVSSRAAGGSRQDRFGVSYLLPLDENFSLRLGGRLNGLAAENYALIASARQGLLWQNRKFSVLQSLAATPQLGLYTLTVTGGSRSLYPLGARGTAHLQQQAEGLSWKTSASLFASAIPYTSLRVSATVERPPAEALLLSLNPSLGIEPPTLSGLHSRFSIGYKLGYRPEGNALSQTAIASLRLRYNRFSLDGSGFYALSGPAGFSVKLGLGWRPLPLTILQAEYSLRSEANYDTAFGLSWQQYWGAGYASKLDLQHHSGEKTDDKITLTVAQKSLFAGPFGLTLAYGVADPDGLGSGSPALTQSFRVQLGYNFSWQFQTPQPVIAVFGGRRVGEVKGVAFIDRNLNGTKDAGEPGVAGLEVKLGGATATTDKQGNYRLLARPGRHKPHLGRLAATLDLYEELELEVKESHSYTLDLALAPTAQLSLLLFHDANHNGRRDEGESGIAYGGIRLKGPVQRSFRTNERGVVLATGLLPGVYEVEPDPAFLPPRFIPTSAAVKITLAPNSAARDAVSLGAAPPRKKVKTTFNQGELAVFVSLPNPVVAAGGEADVRAMVQGKPDAVWVELAGVEYRLNSQGNGKYRGAIRLPASLPTGTQMLRVKASRGKTGAVGTAVLTVVHRPLYALVPGRMTAGIRRELNLALLFHARQVQLQIGEEILEMTSKDGYHWVADWTAAREGEFSVLPVVDGEELTETSLRVLPATTGER